MTEKEGFAGYKVAIGCFIIMFVHSGMLTTIGLFIPGFARDLQLPVSDVALLVTFATGGAFLANFAVPKLLSVIGPRNTLLIATSFCALHYVVFSLANGLPMLYLGGAFGGVCLGVGAQACMAAVISSWFIEKRGTVIGMVFGGAAFGGAVCQFLAGVFIDMYGWRNAYLILTAIIMALGYSANLFLIRTPEKMGQKPLGWDKQEAPGDAARNEALAGVDLPTARGTLSFWLVMAGVTLSGVLITGWQAFTPAFWQASGINQIISSRYASLFSLIGAVGMLYSGVIADKFGNKAYLAYLMAAFIFGTGLLVKFTNVSAFVSIVTITICALGYPLASAVPATVTTEAFGRAHYTKIMAWFTAMLYLGKALSPPLMGAVYRLSGNYEKSYIVLILTAAASFVLLIIAMNIAPMKKLRREAEQSAAADAVKG